MAKKSAFDHLPSAIYIPSVVTEHSGNPFIEALPPYRLVAEMEDALGRFPQIPRTDVDLSDGQRIMKIAGLRSWLEPLSHHEEVIDAIGYNIRASYAARNPTNPSDHRRRVELYRQSMLAGGKLAFDEASSSTAPAMALYGTSGVGKTTVVEFALRRLFPQAIYHPEHRMVQIVYLKLSCPPDGGLKQLLIDIVKMIDDLVGEKHAIGLPSRSPDDLIPIIKSMCRKYNVGMIVIDEIQNLLSRRGLPRKSMLRFFVGLTDDVKVAVVTMGTPLALRLFDGTFSFARRTGDTFVWDRMKFDDTWEYFLRGMLHYQWTRLPVDYGKEISAALYHETQGIPALVTRLFQLVQIEAIIDCSETISTALIYRVAAKRFSVLAPMLTALREKKSVRKWDDVFDRIITEIDRDLDAGRSAKPRRKHVATTREVAMRTLASLYPREDALFAVDNLLQEDPEMDEDTVIERARLALDGNDPFVTELGPSLVEEIATGRDKGLSLGDAVVLANEHSVR